MFLVTREDDQVDGRTWASAHRRHHGQERPLPQDVHGVRQELWHRYDDHQQFLRKKFKICSNCWWNPCESLQLSPALFSHYEIFFLNWYIFLNEIFCRACPSVRIWLFNTTCWLQFRGFQDTRCFSKIIVRNFQKILQTGRTLRVSIKPNWIFRQKPS